MSPLTKKSLSAENRFPMRLLALVVVLSMAVFVGLGAYTWNAYHQLKRIQEQDFRLQELIGVITYLDEAMTMSARMAAATGDLQWGDRYRVFEPRLETATKETLKLTLEEYGLKSAAETSRAGREVIRIEKQALALVRQGRREAAARLLASEAYEAQERKYAKGMRNLSAAIKERVQANLQSERRNVFYALSAIAIALPLLIFAWDGVLRTIGRNVLERQRAAEQIHYQQERLQALHEINLAISSSLDLRAVLKVLMEKIGVLLPYSAALVWLVNQKSGSVECAACCKLDEEEWKGRRLAGIPPLVEAVMASRIPVDILNVQTDPRIMDTEFYRRHGLVSCVGVPLIVEGEVLGVLVFLTSEMHRFAREEVEFLSTLSGQAAIAVQNARLHERAKKQADENAALLEQVWDKTVQLEEANEQLSALYSFSKVTSESLNLANLLRNAMRKIMEVHHFDVGRIYLIDADADELRLVAHEGFPAQAVPQGSYKPGVGFVGKVFASGEPRFFKNIQNDPEFARSASRRFMLQMGYRAQFYLPIRVKHKTVGVMNFASKGAREFSASDVELLSSISNQLGMAAENASLFSELERKHAELEKAGKIKDEFLGFVSHELRTPVSAILGYLGMMRDDAFGAVTSEQEKMLEKVLGYANELLGMIESLLQATRIEAGKLELEKEHVPLAEFMDEVSLPYGIPMDKALTIDWNYPRDLPSIHTDRDKLRHILQNLINNAIKYTDRGRVRITASYDPDAKSVEFRVADTGIGIPRESLASVFEMFRQGDGARNGSRGGVGLGLHIVKKLTEMLGGRVAVESEPGKGSTFAITLPATLPQQAGKAEAKEAASSAEKRMGS